MSDHGQPRTYGVLVGKVRDGLIDPTRPTPHYEIWIVAGGVNYRAAVNVISQDDSQVLAYFDPTYVVPQGQLKLQLAALAGGAEGFKGLTTGPGGQGLDYLTDQLFPLDKMAIIPPEGSSGVTLKNLLDGQIERAKADGEAIAIVFGQYYQDNGADQTFHFSPERGVHDIHMMQGDTGAFKSEDRQNGDGALFLVFKGGETAALFVRFQTQVVPIVDASARQASPPRNPPLDDADFVEAASIGDPDHGGASGGGV